MDFCIYRKLKLSIGEPQQKDATYSLGHDCYLRKDPNKNYYLLQKRECSLRLDEMEMQQLVDIRQTIEGAIGNFLNNKEVKLTQHLGGLIYVSVQSPYYSVDVRKFWIVPDNNKLHPTKIGIPLTFDEYRCLNTWLMALHPQWFD